MSPPTGFAELVSAFAAKQVEAAPFDPIWHFWPGFVRWDGRAFNLQDRPTRFVQKHNLMSPSALQRTTLAGLAQCLDHMGSRSCGPWVIGTTITVHREKMSTAGVWLRPHWPRTEGPRQKLYWVLRNDDPDGWPIAVAALYTHEVNPLIDYMLESDRYADHHDAIQEDMRCALAT